MDCTVNNELYPCARPDRDRSAIGHSGINDRPRPLRDLGPLTDRSDRRSILSWRRIALQTRYLPERATEGE
jgi:hypothetical protein